MPRYMQEFETKDEAYIFFTDYAKLAGFNVRTLRTSKETTEWGCSLSGFHVPKKNESEKKTEKGSKRCGCNAYVKVKEDRKKRIWFFDHVQLQHNHKLNPSPRMLRFMHSHKHLDEGISDLFTIMTSNGVAHQAALNVMSFLHGDRQNWGFTEKDLANM